MLCVHGRTRRPIMSNALGPSGRAAVSATGHAQGVDGPGPAPDSTQAGSNRLRRDRARDPSGLERIVAPGQPGCERR